MLNQASEDLLYALHVCVEHAPSTPRGIFHPSAHLEKCIYLTEGTFRL